MKRIISKVDYDMYQRGQIDPKLALELWYRICKNSTIINSAVEVVKDEFGEKSFFAPAICHMILSNPWDVDKNVYDELVLTLLKDGELNKLTVFGNMTFLSLILLNGALGFDDWYLKLASDGIRNKTQENTFELRYVKYPEISSTGEKLVRYKTEDVDVSLTLDEMEKFSCGNAYDINRVFSLEEARTLDEIAQVFPNLDKRIVVSISELYQLALNYQRINNQEEVPKL